MTPSAKQTGETKATRAKVEYAIQFRDPERGRWIDYTHHFDKWGMSDAQVNRYLKGVIWPIRLVKVKPA
jgi:hypothetical protein